LTDGPFRCWNHVGRNVTRSVCSHSVGANNSVVWHCQCSCHCNSPSLAGTVLLRSNFSTAGGRRRSAWSRCVCLRKFPAWTRARAATGDWPAQQQRGAPALKAGDDPVQGAQWRRGRVASQADTHLRNSGLRQVIVDSAAVVLTAAKTSMFTLRNRSVLSILSSVCQRGS
jgi:hypothetical protein